MLCIVLLPCLMSFVWAVPLQNIGYAQQAVSEYELKAVYLYNFLQFVQWPEPQRSLAKDGTLIIGIVGESPFGSALEELQANVRRSGMKPVTIIYYGPYREDLVMKNCHLLFVSGSEKKNFSRIIVSLQGAPVLTVAEAENFVSSGGMISLIRSQGKVRWMINRAPADKAGLRFSAQLLSIAAKVVEGP